MKNKGIKTSPQGWATTFVSVIIITAFAWMIASSTVLAQTTPPALPELFHWDRTNTGKHWIEAESLQDVQDAFNTARTWETTAIAGQAEYSKIAEMDLVSAFTIDEWFSLSVSERALWLINDARRARGLNGYEGIDPVMNEVTADYAQFLFDNDASGHSADGQNAFERYNAHPQADSQCPTYVQESLSYSGSRSDGTLATFPIAIAVYNWIYTGTPGHRESILYQGDAFVDDTGVIGVEGNIGIAMVAGSGYGAFNSIFDTNVQIVVYNHYETSNQCNSIAAVSADQNSVLINEMDYATDSTTAFIELYNDGTTSQALRHYTINTGSTLVGLPTDVIQPGDYVVLEVDTEWGDTAELLLNGEVVDTVPLSGDVAAEPEFGISRHGDEWLAVCSTPGSENGTRTIEVASCTAPQIAVSQSAMIDTSGSSADVTYTMVLTSDTNVDLATDVLNADNDSGYACGSVTTQVLSNGLTQGMWSCSVSYNLDASVCASDPVHQVTVIPMDGSDNVVSEFSIELVCNAPAEFSVPAHSAKEATTAVGEVATHAVLFEISVRNTGGSTADITLSTTPDTTFAKYNCTEPETQTVLAGETAIWECDARVALDHAVCSEEVTHIATLTSAQLDEPIVMEVQEAIPCYEAPIEVTADQTVAVTTSEEDENIAVLTYDVTFENTTVRDATFTIQSDVDSAFATYQCDEPASNTLSAGDTLAVTCTATVAIAYDNCTEAVSHTIELNADDAPQSFSTTLESSLTCNEAPPVEVAADQTVAITTSDEDTNIAVLTYEVTFNNTGKRDATFTVESAADSAFATYECNDPTNNVLSAGDALTVTCTATVSVAHDGCTDAVSHTIQLNTEEGDQPFTTTLESSLACNSVPLAVTVNNSAVMSNGSPLLAIVLVALMLGASLPIIMKP